MKTLYRRKFWRTAALLACIALPLLALAHEGEEHAAKKPAAAPGSQYFSCEALSDKYEVLVKYGELTAGAESVLEFFLAQAQTNRAIDSANLVVKVLNRPDIGFALTRVDSGMYQLKGRFPANGSYDLQVNISGALGPDFLQVPKIEVGKKLQAPPAEAHSHWYDNPWLWAAVGLLLGLALMYVLMRNRWRKAATTVVVLALLVPTASRNPARAHGGDDHGAGGGKSGGLSSAFVVEKETQFLFDILTQRTGGGSFVQSTELLGTVTASPQGLAVIQAPQTGKIVSLQVTPGQSVSKGQTLAVVEQQVEAGTQLDIIAQRNTLNAEVKAAKAQYDRLLSIADIAAKRDVTEARARYEAALQNLRLFNANVGANAGSTRRISLTAPISGVVGTFNYAIGAVVSAGQTLFELTNLQKVYVETQVFSAGLVRQGGRFMVLPAGDTAAYRLQLVSTAQSVNTENQAQRVVFEVVNPGGRFRIGENVRVLHYSNNAVAQLVVPTAALTDVGGRAAVFIKDKAEQFSLSFVQKGESNPLQTVIVSGVEAGERVVTGNVYQLKMIYLNQ